MGHAQQRAAILFDEVNLDQTRSLWHSPLPSQPKLLASRCTGTTLQNVPRAFALPTPFRT